MVSPALIAAALAASVVLAPVPAAVAATEVGGVELNVDITPAPQSSSTPLPSASPTATNPAEDPGALPPTGGTFDPALVLAGGGLLAAGALVTLTVRRRLRR